MESNASASKGSLNESLDDVNDAASESDDFKCQENGDTAEDEVQLKKKPKRDGIIYLSSVPYFMSIRRVRDYFAQYGEVGRVFLQPKVRTNAAGRKQKRFVEGWIEFKDKDVAKRVALSLNNQQVGGRNRSKAHDCLWNLKYLPRFKWVHLNEQLTYERQIRQQKMRAEISQAKREASFFSQNVEKGKHLKRLEETVLKKRGIWEKYQRQLEQRQTVKETKNSTKDNKKLLSMVFGGSSSSG